MVKLSDGELLDLLPFQMKEDSDTAALSYALKMGVGRMIRHEADVLSIISPENAPEYVLDALAADLRAPYYDQGLPIDVKRQLVKAALPWYMKAGTAAAVEELVSAVFGGGEATEWFELPEGEARPGEFDVSLGTLPTDGTMHSFLAVINAAKNARSHLRRMLVTLSGPLDGPDLLEGRTGKGAYGVEILYLLTYYAELAAMEMLRLPGIRFLLGMDFWDTRRHNGRHRHDGATTHGIWRRYGLSAGIGFQAGGIRNGAGLWMPGARFQAGLRTGEDAAAALRMLLSMEFWGTVFHDGARLHDGTARHWGKRWHTRAGIGFRTGLDFWETRRHDGRYRHDGASRHRAFRRYGIGIGIGHGAGIPEGAGQLSAAAGFLSSARGEERMEASARARTREMYFHDGAHAHDGAARHRTVCREEVLE